MELILAYPAWYLILCLGLAALFSWFLYRNDKSLVDLPAWVLNALRAFRFISIFLLAFLLLEPLLLYINIELRKPLLIVLQDNSKSLLMGRDSAATSKDLNAYWDKVDSELSDKFEIHKYQFDEALSDYSKPSFTGNSTNIGKALSEMYIQHGSGNSGALILASDGLLNEGSDPYYSSNQLNLKSYTLGLGDTSTRADLSFTGFRANKIAYLGNEFPVEFSLKSVNISPQEVEVRLMESETKRYSEKIQITDINQLTGRKLQVEAKGLGLKSFRLEVDFLEEEWTHLNNSLDFSIEVIDRRAKVLLVYNSVHPDIAAIKESLNLSDDFEASESSLSDFDKMSNQALLSNFNLILFHGIPANDEQALRIKSLMDAKMPVFLVFTEQTNLAAFNDLNFGLRINAPQKVAMNEVRAQVNPDFKLFSFEMPEKWQQGIPPLKSPFGVYENSKGVETLLSQRIGQVNTGFPLILYSGITESRKFALLAGEGIWRWRIFDYRVNNSHEKFNELIASSVRYLASKEERGRFRLDYEKRYYQGNKLKMRAELYNASYEPIVDSDVRIKITDSEAKEYEFAFSPYQDYFELDIEAMAAGNYEFEAFTEYDGEQFSKKGAFVIEEKLLEFSESKANHQWLKRFAEKNAGNYYHLDDKEVMLQELLNSDIKPVSNSRERFRLLIEFPWLLLLVLLPFTLEWFLRRRYGSY